MIAFKAWDPNKPRADGQYILGAVLFWANINTIIWQQLAAMLILQSGAIAGAYATRPSLVSLGLMILAAGLTFAIGMKILRNISIRQALIDQTHDMLELLIPNYEYEKDGPIKKVELLDEKKHSSFFYLFHNYCGTIILLLLLLSVDAIVALAFNFPHWFASWHPHGWLPMFPSPSKVDHLLRP